MAKAEITPNTTPIKTSNKRITIYLSILHSLLYLILLLRVRFSIQITKSSIDKEVRKLTKYLLL